MAAEAEAEAEAEVVAGGEVLGSMPWALGAGREALPAVEEIARMSGRTTPLEAPEPGANNPRPAIGCAVPATPSTSNDAMTAASASAAGASGPWTSPRVTLESTSSDDAGRRSARKDAKNE